MLAMPIEPHSRRITVVVLGLSLAKMSIRLEPTHRFETENDLYGNRVTRIERG